MVSAKDENLDSKIDFIMKSNKNNAKQQKQTFE